MAYLTVKQFCEKYEWPTVGALRSIIYLAKTGKNGFATAIRKVNARVLINEEAFWKIIDEDKSNKGEI